MLGPIPLTVRSGADSVHQPLRVAGDQARRCARPPGSSQRSLCLALAPSRHGRARGGRRGRAAGHRAGSDRRGGQHDRRHTHRRRRPRPLPGLRRRRRHVLGLDRRRHRGSTPSSSCSTAPASASTPTTTSGHRASRCSRPEHRSAPPRAASTLSGSRPTTATRRAPRGRSSRTGDGVRRRPARGAGAPVASWERAPARRGAYTITLTGTRACESPRADGRPRAARGRRRRVALGEARRGRTTPAADERRLRARLVRGHRG